MNIRHIRALLLPLGVAMVAIAGLGWYAFLWIPAQQRFLNERNFRLLRTLSAQIEAKVDNFDRALDHALDSTAAPRIAGDKTPPTNTNKALAKFIRLFAPELDLLSEADTSAAKLALEDAGDPPRVVLERDEGRSYLYVGLQHGTGPMVAKADLSLAIGKFLATGDDFDALLLVDRDGIVIDQHSPLGLELARVDQLPPAAPRPAGASDKPNGETASSFHSLRMSNNSTDVLVGDATYKLYVQPIQLSLVRASARRAAAPADIKREMSDETEEWALCALVRADKFRAASSAISYTYLLWLSAGLALVFCAIPLLKLRVLSPRERLTRTDGVLISSAAFFVTGLAVFIVLDVYHFGRDFPQRTDTMLADTARVLQQAVREDILGIGAEMEVLNRDLDVVLAAARSEDWSDEGPRITVGERGSKPSFCTPSWACRKTIFRTPPDPGFHDVVSPFVDLVNWSDASGQQQVKWTTGRRLTPFINVFNEKVEYYEALKAAQVSPSAPKSGIAAVLSPNTGEMLTVFWRLVPAKVVAGEHTLVAESAALSHYLPAFDSPVLPPRVQFAVVTRQGKVVYHSNSARGLKENFVQESQDDFALKSLIASARTAAVTAYYGGTRHRMYVTPLAVPAESFTDPHWSLIVFQDAAIADTLNLETLTVGVGPFVLWGATLLIVWGVAAWVAPERITKWFWPRQAAARRYAAVAWTNGAIAVAALAAIVRLPPGGVLIAAIAAAGGSTIATFLIVTTASPSDGATRAWTRDFVWARVSWLFVQAAVPAIACFCVAYDFEASLFVRDGQLQLVRSVNDHHDALRKRLEPLGLADPEQFARRDPAPSLRAFFETASVAPRGETLTASHLDSFLRLFHRRYNAIAVEPDAVSVDWTAQRRDRSHVLVSHAAALPGGSAVLASAAPLAHHGAASVLLIGLMFGAVYLLVRGGVEPLFLLGVEPPTAATADATIRALPIVNTIFVGLPGSADLARIGGERIAHIFDVRTLATDRRRQTRPVPLERRQALRSPIAVGATGGSAWSDPPPPAEPRALSRWAEAFDYGQLPHGGALVGIDHIDHRFDDPEFREQTLTLLEQLLYRYQRVLWIAADRDPLDRLSDSETTAAERERWRIVLSSFTRRLVPTTIPIAADDGFDADAQPFYRSVWDACSTDEKLALRHLVDEDVVNPRNASVIAALACKGLVRRERTFHVASEPFRRFILNASSTNQVTEWEHENVKLPWTTLSTTLATVAFGIGGLLVFTQQQLLDAWVGFMPTLAPVVPTMLKWLASAHGGPKSATHV